MRIQNQSANKFTEQLKQQQQALPKPSWLKIRPPTTDKFSAIRALLKAKKLHTVCEEAHCPNISECWSGGTATFMLMGDTCTRACRFCMVKSGNPRGLLDRSEPKHLVESVKIMGLDYVVLTCVTRDDLPDGGAGHFATCVSELKKHHPKLLIEVLISDLNGNIGALQKIVDASPDVLAHNLETVERLQSAIRDPRANYKKSLDVLANAKKIHGKILAGQKASLLAGQNTANSHTAHSLLADQKASLLPPQQKIYTKSSIMLGLGETLKEVTQTMKDLRVINTDIITFGQYLRPSPFHVAVHEYITPATFKKYEIIAKELGFLYCASGPFVRSSYRAGELFMKNIILQGVGSKSSRHNRP